MRWAEFVIGLVLVAGVTASVMHTVAGPFGRVSRLAAAVGRTVEMVGFSVGRRLPAAARHRALALVGPAAFLLVLISWLVLYLLAFGLILAPMTGGGLADSLRLAGSSMFTLGYVRAQGAAAAVISLVAAATGLLVITAELAYLPSLYAAYNRREQAVTLLASRTAGVLTGDAVLLAHADWPSGLEELYRDWERWAADVIETHGNYPILSTFRSADSSCPWVYALLAMLDAAALHVVLELHPEGAKAAARLLDIGQRCVNTISAGSRLPATSTPPATPPGLDHLDLAALVLQLEAAGQPARTDPDTARERLGDRCRAWAEPLDSLGRRLAYEIPPDTYGRLAVPD